MTRMFLFALAVVALTVAAWLLPKSRRHWAAAMRAELAEAESGRAAAGFAFGCLSAAAGEAMRFNILEPLARAGKGSRLMPLIADLPIRPRFLAMVAALIATGLGLAYLAMAGAPARLMAVNALALLIGFAGLALALAAARAARVSAGVVSLALGAALLATSLFGLSVEGASRWVALAGFVLQPSLIFVPLLLVYCARGRDDLSIAGVMLAVVAMALQPDRAMAGVMLAALAVLAAHRRDARTLAALTLAALGFAWTLMQADQLPAMPYVDKIVYSSFGVHPLAGLAVAAGLTWMLVPAVVGRLADPAHGEAYLVFGAVWLAVIAAAMLGNYPTPLVGYGASAIIGYAVSLIGLPARRAHAAEREGSAAAASDTPETSLRVLAAG